MLLYRKKHRKTIQFNALNPALTSSPTRGFYAHTGKSEAERNILKWLSLSLVKKLADEEEKTLLTCCVLHPTRKENKIESVYWLHEIVLFALNTGMRQDEILSLEWPNADLFRKTVLVVKSKNGEKRTIPMNQKVFELVKTKARENQNKSKFVFPNEAGTKILRRNLMRAFYNARDRAKIEDFTFHDLRHAFATRLAQAGIPLVYSPKS